MIAPRHYGAVGSDTLAQTQIESDRTDVCLDVAVIRNAGMRMGVVKGAGGREADSFSTSVMLGEFNV